MFRHRVSLVALAFLAVAGTAEAQRRSPSVARVTPYVGYIHYGNYVDGPFGTSVRNGGAPVYGAQLGIDLTDNLAFTGNAGYSASSLQVGLPILGGFDLADTRVFLYDAGLQYRLPATNALGAGAVPFIEGGAGAMRTELLVGSLKTQSTNLALNYGAGVDLKLGNSLGVRVAAKDYVGKLDLKEATMIDISTRRTHNVAVTVGMNIGF